MAWKSTVCGVLRHPERPAVLLMRSDRRWGLPRSVVAGDLWAGSADRAVEIIGKRLGLSVWVHRCLYAADDPARERIDLVFETVAIDPSAALPANGRWVDRAALDEVPLSDEGRRGLLERYLDRLESGVVPPQRPPWCGPGWLDEVRPWIEANVRPHPVVGLDQIKQWSISAVLRVRTSGPTFYFKVSADLPLFVDEGAVSNRLASLFDGFVLAPLAVEAARGWMLFPDLGDIEHDRPIEAKEKAFRRLAELHLQSIPLTNQLLTAGCLDRRLDVLASQMDDLLGDRRIMGRLEEKDRRLLRRNKGTLRDRCAELEALGIPDTLVHGDFHMGNVGGTDDQMMFDWTDACVAHPFFDLHSLAWESRENADRLRAAYLEAWEGFVGAVDVDRALELSRLLMPLHHAVSYKAIADSLEPEIRPELDFAHAFLRSLAKDLREMGRLHRIERADLGGVEDGGATELAVGQTGGDLGTA